MTPFPYAVRCYEPGCTQAAEFKIAAQWSDGLTRELKTYGLTCAAHLRAWYLNSVQKQAVCPRAEDETLEPPGIYRLEAQRADKQLERLLELETQFVSPCAEGARFF